MTTEPPASAPLRTAIGFPGQGGDWRAALGVLAANADHPLVRALADRLGTDEFRDLDGLDTRNAQPVVYVSGLVGPTAGLADQAAIEAVIGHSLGEITGAAWAGAINPEVGLDLVITRAALGHQQHAARAGAMAAIMRVPVAQVEWLRRQVLADHPGVLDVAVINSPEQVVLSGDEALVARAVDLAEAQGAVARHLPIGGAYHSPLMVGVLEPFRTAVAAAVTAPTRVPLVSSTSARVVSDADELVDVLVRSLVLPVRWPDAVAVLADLGIDEVIDGGPGDTLVRLGRFLPRPPFRAG
jgi:[acyl-carrier-protein] S-malonyltransferase